MSMSTLGQQLAAINAAPGKTNVGSSLSTSRRHDDAIGRGLAHSVQVGHSVNKSLYKASIIYEDSRKASDVPLATIQENCVASLRRLEELDPEFGVYVKSLCKPSIQERGLLTSTENENIDKIIEDLIFRLAPRMTPAKSKSNNGTLQECFHVIEFLLRKFDLHIRPKTATATLLAMLPHHEQPFFLRILQLMDLANMPEWTFLRPFAVPGARVARSVFAQQASKDVAFLRSIGWLSKRNAKLPCCERSLSFTGAVLVEALTLQTQRKGTMEERTCQALLPFVVAACRNQTSKKNSTLTVGSHREWQHWGYVLASTMVETSILEVEPRNLLVNSVLEGLVQQTRQCSQNMATMKQTVLSSLTSSLPGIPRDLEQLLLNGLTVALTVLLQDHDASAMTRHWDSYGTMPKVDGRLEVWCTSTNASVAFGFGMKKDTLGILIALDDAGANGEVGSHSSIVADCFGQLFSKQGIIEMRHWIATILVLGWKVICSAGVRNKKEQHSNKILKLLVALLEQQPHLIPLWKDSEMQWVESYAIFLVTDVPITFVAEHMGDSNEEFFFFSHAKKILQSLRNLNILAFEKGLTRALLLLPNKHDRKIMVDWLRHIGLFPQEQTEREQENEKELPETLSEVDAILPPRVALEHADPEVRLKAIPSLMGEATVDSSVCQALFQCIMIDENAMVVIAAASAMQHLLCYNTMNNFELGKGLIEAYHRWFLAQSVSEKERIELLVSLCHITSKALRELKSETSEASNKLLARLMEILGALMSYPEPSVSAGATVAILEAWDERFDLKNQAENRSRANELLISKKFILHVFRRRFESQHKPFELSIRRMLMHTVLDALLSVPNVLLREVYPEGIEYCCWVYETFSNNLKNTEASACTAALLALTEFVSADPELMRTTVLRLSIGDKDVFSQIVAPFIEALCTVVGNKMKTEPLPILMEWALSVDDSEQIQNLMITAHALATGSPRGCFYSIVPAMTLVANTDDASRKTVLDLLNSFTQTISSGDTEWSMLSAFGRYLQENRAILVSNGTSFLSHVLSSVLRNDENVDMLRDYLLRLSLCFAASATPISPLESTVFDSSWLAIGDATGGYRAVIAILEATEMAGEECFPLLSRWRLLGKPLLDAFLQSGLCHIAQPLEQMLLLAVRMMKGVTVLGKKGDINSSKSTIITTGPTLQGGRSRSYSFGKNDSSSYLHPYPKDMENTLVRILQAEGGTSILLIMKAALCEHVLGSNSWKQEIFCSLGPSSREDIALSLIHSASRTDVRNAEELLLSLPLKAADVKKLFSCKILDDKGLSQVILASEFICANALLLIADQGYELLMEPIVELLTTLGMAEMDNSHDFVRLALLDAMQELTVALAENSCNGGITLESTEGFNSWMNILVDQVLDKGLTSQRTAKSATTTLAASCKCFPRMVAPKVLQVVEGVATNRFFLQQNLVSLILDLTIPVLLEHAHLAGLSIPALFKSFIKASNTHQEPLRHSLYRQFIASLRTLPTDDAFSSPIGLFVVAVLAEDVVNTSIVTPHDQYFTRLIGAMLSDINAQDRLAVASTMQAYARDTLCSVLNEEQPSRPNNLPSLKEFLVTARNLSEQRDLKMVYGFCEVLSVATCEVLSMSDMQSLVSIPTAVQTRKLLLLWQECLLTQVVCQRQEVATTLAMTSNASGQSMEMVQNCLPPHIYLAFVTNLMKEGGMEIRCRAVQTIGERAQSLSPKHSESELLLEMVSTLLEVIHSSSISSPGTKMLQHFAFLAIDSIGRKCCISHIIDNSGKSSVRLFASVASSAADSMWKEIQSNSWNSFDEVPSDSRLLISSATICAATAVKICGSKAIPALQKLVPSLLDMLTLVNNGIENQKQSDWNYTRLFQLSILRTLKIVVTTLPNFLKQHLNKLLTAILVNTTQFQNTNDTTLESEFGILRGVVSSSIPSRQLIPAALSTISMLTGQGPLAALLKMLSECVKATKSAEVSSQMLLILKVVFYAFEHGAGRETNDVWHAANDLVLCLVMKQSETQFRRLYQKIWVWQSEQDQSLAFWQLSSMLSRSLKFVFLPCLTIAFSDTIEELETASTILCREESKKSSDRKKRQKLLAQDSFDQVQLATLKSLLQCLEASLHSDAQNGGAWIRDTEAKRFDALLQPLGKLLSCCLPCDGSVGSFQAIVLGQGHTSGSVVGCIVGLASAAGDEQLWKPLNHVVLQACGHGSRKEVRKAGISCLLSLIQSIGEEYMVLIPECLPILGELLEDSDEEIAQLARECISQSEELLGESLQDNLM
ncbi:BP28CT NUC211 domain containing protein [Nitzschia inconspicua]|uniref:HEAT repeat-containing protein 1 n=1 Tax=Nitzschia inconspicua TaxID=303405 RepID=A0A9K3PKY2_9STRA|nr:BP28CT NUC211 domain containing protein [Nitzschia inconspicua]